MLAAVAVVPAALLPSLGVHGHVRTAVKHNHAWRMQESLAGPQELGPDECYLFDTEEGRKYVCTSDAAELAWHMGLDLRDLVSGHKPEDLNLIECAEEWSHTGTPQWVCKEEPVKVQSEDEGCELIGETPNELWFACSDTDGDKPGVDCTEDTTFGVGGGPGILPQEGEVLCKQPKLA